MPKAHIVPREGGFFLDAHALLRLAYESPPNKLKPGPRRDRIAAFQARVNTFRAARRRATAEEPTLQETLESLVSVDRIKALIAKGDLDGAIEFILETQVPA